MKKEEDKYKFSKVVLAWQENLKGGGYEHHIYKKSDCKKLAKFYRVWRRIFKSIDLNHYKRNDLSIFEVGCGGGKYLVQFALNDYRTIGIDCSKEVLERARNYIKEVSEVSRRNLDVELIYGDFLNFNSPRKFDLVFHSGVIEHFLDKDERMSFLKKMFALTKPGGYIISIVPHAIIHPFKREAKKDFVGCSIPSIDYTPNLMVQEFRDCGGREIKILPHNLFFYLLSGKENSILLIKKLLYYVLQLTPPSILPLDFAYTHAGTLIGIAKK